MNYAEEAIVKHREWHGKIEIKSKVDVTEKDILSLAYTPGVAYPCLEIQKDINQSFTLTGRSNTVAVITDGSAVLGLGDIGPEAAMPVMEGKCVLFREFGKVNAFPLCIRSRDTDEIVNTVKLLQGSFGGINLEDISAPRCFEIEDKLKKCCEIPVFHDDQHGTAIVTLAALMNSLKLTGRKTENTRITVNGAGAAGIAIVKLLLKAGLKDITVCDRKGIIHKGRSDLNPEKQNIARITNVRSSEGTLRDAIKNSDVFIGVSVPGCVTGEMIKTMASHPIIFPLANPEPEIFPNEAMKSGAAIVGTGRSDFPNQINNVLVFPGIFRGALDVKASEINDEMKLAAAEALMNSVSADELRTGKILPSALNHKTAELVASAVAEAAVRSGAART